MRREIEVLVKNSWETGVVCILGDMLDRLDSKLHKLCSSFCTFVIQVVVLLMNDVCESLMHFSAIVGKFNCLGHLLGITHN